MWEEEGAVPAEKEEDSGEGAGDRWGVDSKRAASLLTFDSSLSFEEGMEAAAEAEEASERLPPLPEKFRRVLSSQMSCGLVRTGLEYIFRLCAAGLFVCWGEGRTKAKII